MKKFILSALFTLFTSTAFANTIKIATMEWAPYCSEEAGKSMHLDLVKAAFAKVGYTVEVDFITWKRALKMTETGEYDAIACIWNTHTRDDVFAFSDKTFSANEMVLFKRADSKITFDGDLTQLKQYKLGTVAGQNYSKDITYSGLNLQPANSDISNLKRLLGNRIDLFINDKVTTLALLERELPNEKDQIDYISTPVSIDDLHIAFSRKGENHKQQLSDFNRGLSMLLSSGKVEEIHKQYGLKE